MKTSFKEAPDLDLNAAIKMYPHDGLLYRVLVQFIPKKITPNYVTFMRFVLAPVVFYLIVTGRLGWGLILFIIAACTDAIDGTMARTRKSITKWGMVYDPVADKFLIGGVLFILLVRHVNIYLASIIISIEVIYLIAGMILKRHDIIKAPSFWGKSKMFLQSCGIGFILLGLWANLGYANNIAQWLLGISVAFSLINLYKYGLGL